LSKQVAALTQKNNATLDHLRSDNPTTSKNNNFLMYENPTLGMTKKCNW
jgi:hypothetical protein